MLYASMQGEDDSHKIFPPYHKYPKIHVLEKSAFLRIQKAIGFEEYPWAETLHLLR
jgi:hypothetical protein